MVCETVQVIQHYLDWLENVKLKLFVSELQRYPNSYSRTAIAETPPNTPSSGGSESQSILKGDIRTTTEAIIKDSRKPSGGSLIAKDSGLESEDDDQAKEKPNNGELIEKVVTLGLRL